MPLTYDEIKFKKQTRKRKGGYVSCENCGREFYLTPKLLKEHNDPLHRRGRWCSRECQKEFHAVEKVCPVCGKSFKVPRGVAHRYTACSLKCSYINIKDYKCKRCGKTFRSSEKRWKPKYCSEECRRPPIYINCKNCGIEFRKIPADKDRQFCSFACYRRYQGETGIEKIVRRSLDLLDLGHEYIQEAKIGRYAIDFYIPDLRIAIEADGSYWHRDPERDKCKDNYLAKHNINVIRLTEDEINSCDIARLINYRIDHITCSIIPPSR